MTQNILAFPAPRAERDLRSLQTKVEAYQKIIRVFAAQTTAVELMILCNLTDRTIGWGREEVYVTTRAMREGDDVYPALAGISRATQFRALATLEEKRMIFRRHDPKVPDRVHYKINLDWSADMSVNLLERLQTQSHKCDAPVSPVRLPRLTGETLYTGNQIQVSDTGSHSETDPGFAAIKTEKIRGKSPPLAPRARKRLVVAVSRYSEAVPVPLEGECNSTIGDVIERVWRCAVRETFPGHPAPVWAKRQKSQAKTTAQKWKQRDVAFHDFVDWCARNWTAIMRKQFKWMTKQAPPTVPTTQFLFAFLDQFIECYAEGKLEQWLTDKDRTQLERLMARGQTYEQATAALAEAKVTAALRGEMEKREQAVKIDKGIAVRARDQAQRLAEFGGVAPPHPRSRNAQAKIVAVEPKPTVVCSDDLEFPPLAPLPMLDMDRNPFDDDEG